MSCHPKAKLSRSQKLIARPLQFRKKPSAKQQAQKKLGAKFVPAKDGLSGIGLSTEQAQIVVPAPELEENDPEFTIAEWKAAGRAMKRKLEHISGDDLDAARDDKGRKLIDLVVKEHKDYHFKA